MSQNVEAEDHDAGPVAVTNARRPWGRRWKLFALVVGPLVAAEAVGIALIYRTEREALARDSHKTEVGHSGEPYALTFAASYTGPAPRRPQTRPASESQLAADEPILGVSVGGRYRAYRLAPFNKPTQHVVNDVLNDSAVTMTYCDVTRCVRAFTVAGRQDPLDIEIWGLMKGRMALRLTSESVPYDQETGKRVDSTPGANRFPYATTPVEQTTWGHWKAAHPETDVYEGP